MCVLRRPGGFHVDTKHRRRRQRSWLLPPSSTTLRSTRITRTWGQAVSYFIRSFYFGRTTNKRRAVVARPFSDSVLNEQQTHLRYYFTQHTHTHTPTTWCRIHVSSTVFIKTNVCFVHVAMRNAVWNVFLRCFIIVRFGFFSSKCDRRRRRPTDRTRSIHFWKTTRTHTHNRFDGIQWDLFFIIQTGHPSPVSLSDDDTHSIS